MESDMSHVAIDEVAPPGPSFSRHRPEQTRLYQIVDRHYTEFRDMMTAQGKPLAPARTTRIYRLPQVWTAGTRIPAGAMQPQSS